MGCHHLRTSLQNQQEDTKRSSSFEKYRVCFSKILPHLNGKWQNNLKVNIPDRRNTYCKKCNKHTEHKVSQYKKSKEGRNSQGTRRYRRKQRGYHGQTKPILRRKAKVTKKLVIKLRCTVCDAKHQQTMKRTKHVEFGGKKKTKGQALTY